MNKYIVAVEDEDVIVNADGLETTEDGLLFFYVNPDGEKCGLSTAARGVAAFKEYRYFILEGEAGVGGAINATATAHKNMDTGETFLALTGDLQANIGDHIHIQGVDKPVEFVASGILVREVK